MGLSVFMSIILCPPILFLQFFKEVLKRRASAYGYSSFSLMGNNFQAGYNRHEGFDKVDSLGRRRGWGGEPFSRSGIIGRNETFQRGRWGPLGEENFMFVLCCVSGQYQIRSPMTTSSTGVFRANTAYQDRVYRRVLPIWKKTGSAKWGTR